MYHGRHQFHLEKVHRVEGHRCSLPIEDESVDLYIDGGVYVDLRRRLRQHWLIDPADPQTRSILRSSAQIRSEEIRHLRQHYYMIHPFSQGRAVWESIMIIVYLGHFILMPVQIALPVVRHVLTYLKLICDFFSWGDIVLFFFTGYYDVSAGRVVMNPRKVAKHYFFRFFIFDVIGTMPYSTILMYLLKEQELFRLRYLYVVRLCRLPTLVAYIRKFFMRMDVWNYKLSVLNFSVYLITLFWWSMCLSFMIYEEVHGFDVEYHKENPEIFNPIFESVYQVIRTFMLVSLSKIQINEEKTLIFNLLCLFFGSVLNMIVLSTVFQMYKRRSNAKTKYDKLVQEIGQYMEYKEMPVPLKNKVFRYVEFKYQKNVFRESDILLSKILKEDVGLHHCKEMVERVDFFKGLPAALILRIVNKLRSEIYLPNDTIVNAGVAGNAMYFIYIGTVAVYTSTDKEVCHLEDGSHFGEISLLINEPRVASVIAVTNCEVFRLVRKDFLEAIEPYPRLSNKIKKLALARLTTTKRAMAADLSKNILEQYDD